MVSRKDLLSAILHEINVCKHLFTKIPEGGADYRPSDKQRSTLELLEFLATGAIGPMKSMAYNDWEEYAKLEKEMEGMRLEEFPEAMDRQAAQIQEVFSAISDDDLQRCILHAPGAGEMPLGSAIMRTSYAWLVAYRQELFLRIKAAGNYDINTTNNWVGVDPAPKEKVVEEGSVA